MAMFALDGAATVSEAIISSLSTTATDCLSLVTSALPIALPVVGAGILVAFGINTFKRVTSKA